MLQKPLRKKRKKKPHKVIPLYPKQTKHPLKSQKILLEIEDEDEEITLGLIRLAKEVPEHELFTNSMYATPFQIN